MSEIRRMGVKDAAPRSGAQNSKFKRLVEVLQNMVDEEFTGHLKINFSQGGIGRIEKFEEILRSGHTNE